MKNIYFEGAFMASVALLFSMVANVGPPSVYSITDAPPLSLLLLFRSIQVRTQRPDPDQSREETFTLKLR